MVNVADCVVLVDASSMVSQLETTVNGVTANIKKANLAKTDVKAVISVSINIIVVRGSPPLHFCPFSQHASVDHYRHHRKILYPR